MYTPLTNADTQRRRSGQAAIELAFGIVWLVGLFVVCGLFYLKVAAVQRGMVTTLRGEAGVRAQTVGSTVDLADYLLTWDNGFDETPYTADDRPITSLPFTLASIAAHSVRNTGEWDAYIGDLPNPTPIYGLHVNPLPMLELAMVKAEHPETVYIDAEDDPQGWFTWLYGRDHVHVTHAVWLPIMAGPHDPDDPDMRGGFL